MATGPEHYERAEELISDYRAVLNGQLLDPDVLFGLMLTEAQVHATLALAAATALGSLRADDHGMFPEDGDAWLSAASASDWRRSA